MSILLPSIKKLGLTISIVYSQSSDVESTMLDEILGHQKKKKKKKEFAENTLLYTAGHIIYIWL